MKNNFESSTPALAKYAQPIIYKKYESHKDPHLNRLIKPLSLAEIQSCRI
jgi:hypothetical protein